MNDQQAMNDQQRREVFARIFSQNDRWLYAYLVTLLGNAADAEEVYQEVCVVLWREYEKFDPDSHFRRWASVIARNRVMRFRTVNNRSARLLSDKAVELLAEEAVEYSQIYEERRLALRGCLEKLPVTDRDLVTACYSDIHQSFREVAQELGRPVNTVYKAIQRVRRVLRDCVERTVAAEGHG
jgi:RNA polymerase sigma-70 factor (ECF subfamily)